MREKFSWGSRLWPWLHFCSFLMECFMPWQPLGFYLPSNDIFLLCCWLGFWSQYTLQPELAWKSLVESYFFLSFWSLWPVMKKRALLKQKFWLSRYNTCSEKNWRSADGLTALPSYPVVSQISLLALYSVLCLPSSFKLLPSPIWKKKKNVVPKLVCRNILSILPLF